MWPFKKKQISNPVSIRTIDEAIRYISERKSAIQTVDIYTEAKKLLIEAQRTSKQTTQLLKQMAGEIKQ